MNGTKIRRFWDASLYGQNSISTTIPRAASASQSCPELWDAGPLGLKLVPFHPTPISCHFLRRPGHAQRQRIGGRFKPSRRSVHRPGCTFDRRWRDDPREDGVPLRGRAAAVPVVETPRLADPPQRFDSERHHHHMRSYLISLNLPFVERTIEPISFLSGRFISNPIKLS